MTETIIAVAIQRAGVIWTLPRPARHHHVIAAINDAHPVRGPLLIAEGAQGFVTSGGRFVDRVEAARIARASGQIASLAAPPNLYSEDLW